MLTDFAKLETFLTVVRENLFSKSFRQNSRISNSCYSTTNEIYYYLDYFKIVDEKNGIKLTKKKDKYYMALH